MKPKFNIDKVIYSVEQYKIFARLLGAYIALKQYFCVTELIK